jgi:hypothetical protein
VKIWRDALTAFADVVIPLNRDGFRADVIPVAGGEFRF